MTWQWSTVATRRPIQLVRLDGNGLTNLGTTRSDVIEGDRSIYTLTQAWAEALLSALPEVDGFGWMSRQAPHRRASALVARVDGRPGGVIDADLEGRGPALPFALRVGLDELDRISMRTLVHRFRPSLR